MCGSALLRTATCKPIGWDAKGRKQYRYHPLYRAIRDQAKFSRMIAFGTVLALIRKEVEHDLNRRGLPKEKVLATVVRLLETTYIRVGNDEYAKENDSFGLTTMRDRHVRIAGSKLLFRFRGKSGQDHTIDLTDQRLARIVKQVPGSAGLRAVPVCKRGGQDLPDRFGRRETIYSRALTKQEFTAKDFRTWAGTVMAAREFHGAGPCPSARSRQADHREHR